MDLEAFKATLQHETPPKGMDAALQAMWHQGKGAWDRAHACVQAQHDAGSAWVHAHLHRIKGDDGNAAFWYRKAGRPHAHAPLQTEWEEIVSALLAARR